jgi:hypothetical protein
VKRAASFLLALSLAGVAEAQLKAPPSPGGEWSFVSSNMPDECVLSGDMLVRKAASGFTCSFTASWACKTGNLPRLTKTQQSCTATQNGNDISITSKVGKVISTQPPGMEELMLKSYLADNFSVTINAAGDEMDGRSFDPANQARIKFRRKDQLIS